MIAIHVPVWITGCSNRWFTCSCRWQFSSETGFRRHVREATGPWACPKCGQVLSRAKGRGFNRVKINDRFAHKDCSLDEGKAKAERRQSRKAEEKEHREAVRLAILRGERL